MTNDGTWHKPAASLAPGECLNLVPSLEDLLLVGHCALSQSFWGHILQVHPTVGSPHHPTRVAS